jgi:RNA polymerase sigma-70 factor, ECF subfamily
MTSLTAAGNEEGAARDLSGTFSPPASEARDALALETPRLLALAYSVLHDRYEAADAVQDTLERALRSWPSVRQPDRVSSWLSTICVRQALKAARRRQRLSLLAFHATPQKSVGPTDTDLEQALRRLTARQRAVVGLHYIYGYTLDEAAALVGCRPGTARSHLNRALSKLREALGDEA